jgi:hypothetical protein
MFGSFSVARARLQSLANQAAHFLSGLQPNPSNPVILAQAPNHSAFAPLPLTLGRAHLAL